MRRRADERLQRPQRAALPGLRPHVEGLAAPAADQEIEMTTYARYALSHDGAELPTTSLDTDRLTIRELYTALRPELEKLDDGFEYFSISTTLQYTQGNRQHQPIGRYRWIACYAVTGGSEGHYIHVDRIYEAEPYARQFTHEAIFLAKTFSGYERACQIAAYLGSRLGA
jgi:hypothetical protein